MEVFEATELTRVRSTRQVKIKVEVKHMLYFYKGR